MTPGDTIFTVWRWLGGKPAVCNHFPRSLTIGKVLREKSLRAPLKLNNLGYSRNQLGQFAAREKYCRLARAAC